MPCKHYPEIPLPGIHVGAHEQGHSEWYHISDLNVGDGASLVMWHHLIPEHWSEPSWLAQERGKAGKGSPTGVGSFTPAGNLDGVPGCFQSSWLLPDSVQALQPFGEWSSRREPAPPVSITLLSTRERTLFFKTANRKIREKIQQIQVYMWLVSSGSNTIERMNASSSINQQE